MTEVKDDSSWNSEITAIDAAVDVLRERGLAHLAGDALVAGIDAQLFGPHVNSDDRAALFLDLTEIVDSEVFWKVFHRCWALCDDTWDLTDQLIESLAFHHSHDHAILHMTPQQDTFYKALPNVIKVFRGCSEGRVNGISWTTDRNVAVKFAKGHRGISVPTPVLVSATIRKADIYTVLTDREESEIILNPTALRKVSVTTLNAVVL